MDKLADGQRQLFQAFEDLFRSGMGRSSESFHSDEEFLTELNGQRERISKALITHLPTIYTVYAQYGEFFCESAVQIGGLKLCLGGTFQFGSAQLSSVIRMVLYSDTVLIADPVAGLLEKATQTTEGSPYTQIFMDLFPLLRLKPLVDADLEYPPVLVYPSWQRRRLREDGDVEKAADEFFGTVLGPFFGEDWHSGKQAFRCSALEGTRFLETVRENALFIGPNGAVDEPLELHLKRYIEEIGVWRSKAFRESVRGLSEAELICYAIFERLQPSFNLMSMAQEMHAQPLLAVEQHAHYFRLSSAGLRNHLVYKEDISKQTNTLVEVLSREQFAWLSGVPITGLVEMRQRNENESFRDKLTKAASILNEASADNIDRVAAELTRSIGTLLNDYRAQVKKIEETYKPKYGQLALTAGLSLCATLLPHVSPLIGVATAPILLGTQYGSALLDERREKKRLSGSLVGILASADAARI